MQRPLSLMALCLFALLFCLTAASDPRGNNFTAPRIEEPSPAPPEKHVYPIKMENADPRDPSPPPSAAGEKPETGPTPPENEGMAGEKAEPAAEPAVPGSSPPETASPISGSLPEEETDGIHFLLIGRWWDDPAAKMLMMVTLIPKGCARITALDPATAVALEGKPCPVGELLQRGGSRDQLYLAVTALTGLAPQFYIDLNLHGFVEMTALLQKDIRDSPPSRSGAAPEPGIGFDDGEGMLLLLNDASVPTAAKEEMLIRLLLAACEIQFTRLGLKLLWMGYHNLKTDLSLRDLLEIRRITQGIAPTEVILREIAP